jgi:hypothetical protein
MPHQFAHLKLRGSLVFEGGVACRQSLSGSMLCIWTSIVYVDVVYARSMRSDRERDVRWLRGGARITTMRLADR